LELHGVFFNMNSLRVTPWLFKLAFICLLSLGGLLSCGLEDDDYYIDYITQGVYNDTSAGIILPSDARYGYDNYFDNFIIFYRIYISENIVNTGMQLTGYGNNSDRTAISSTLNSDYNGLYSLTDITSTNVNTQNLENTFGNRKYFLLTLENVDINTILGSGSLGGRLDIAFPPNPGTRPTLSLNGFPFFLQRAIKNENLNLYDLNPLPNRDFLNHPELYKADNITTGRNADVATSSAANIQYTYIAMYIAAKGTSRNMPPRSIYSQPTFIGIFRLAEWS